MEDLADDLAFGVTVLRARAAHTRAEIALRDSEQKFKDLLESAPDAMVIVNQDAEIVLVNAQASICSVDTRHRDFKAFHFEQAIAFKKHLAEQKAQRSGEKLSKATLNATLANVKRFFHWLAGQPGYKSRLQYSDADYFNLSEKDVRVATARREQVGPTVEQVKHVITMMPVESAIQRRDRALVAFTLLTGARDSAIASIKLKHVNLAAGYVEQGKNSVGIG